MSLAAPKAPTLPSAVPQPLPAPPPALLTPLAARLRHPVCVRNAEGREDVMLGRLETVDRAKAANLLAHAAGALRELLQGGKGAERAALDVLAMIEGAS